MITFVNTVLVGNAQSAIAESMDDATKGMYIIVDNDGKVIDTAAKAATAEAIKVGIGTGNTVNHTTKSWDAVNKDYVYTTVKKNVIKWSNIIKKADIKSYHVTNFAAETEDKVYFDFSPVAAITCATKDPEEVRVVVRLTFKDMDTRYRKWSESFEIIAPVGMTAKQIAQKFVGLILGKSNVRSRMQNATIESTTIDALTLTDALCLEAKKYDDDETVDSISPANKVRFTGNAWYTRPEADGFESKNKYSAAIIAKKPGNYPTGTWKLVRDAEAQAMGYQGILNRGEGTWPIIKPEMAVEKNASYNSITLEFENMYRTADDLQRRTKQTLQIFENTSAANSIKTILEAFISGKATGATAADIKPNTSDVND